MGEPLNRIPVVRRHEPDKSLLLASYIVLILDLAFFLWGVVRLVFIAVPRLQFATVEIIYSLMAFTRESYLDLIYDALKRLLLLPPASLFNLPDVVLNAFVTLLVFVTIFGLHRWLRSNAMNKS